MGVKAAHVDGEDHAARRDRIMAEFRDGAIQVVGNCDLISEGFDAPGCSVIMMGSPTQSITRYLQQAGRAMRPGPGKRALILDLAGISHELGLPDEPREWTLEDGEVWERRKKKPKAARVPAMPYDVFTGGNARSAPTSRHWPRSRKREPTWWRRRDGLNRTRSARTALRRVAGAGDCQAAARRARRSRGHSQAQGLQARLGRAYLERMGDVMATETSERACLDCGADISERAAGAVLCDGCFAYDRNDQSYNPRRLKDAAKSAPRDSKGRFLRKPPDPKWQKLVDELMGER